MASKILQFEVYDKSKMELLNEIENFEKVHLVSGNPEVLYAGIHNETLLENFTSHNSIIFPDGIGTVICSRIVNQHVKEKIAGIELLENIIKNCAKKGTSIYLLGAKKEVLDMCIINLYTKYPNLIIDGSHDGYFDIHNCENIICDIEEKKPYAVFVAMGCPRQELFIIKYMDRLPCKIFMGVGGSFDVIAGNVKRAPKWMINLGLEWMYRITKEPSRIKRLFSIPKFIILVLKEKWLNK